MGKNKAIAGLVLGIVGIVLTFVWPGWGQLIAIAASVVGLVMSVQGGKALKAEGQPSGLATAGLVLSIVAVALSSIMFLSCGICTICVQDELNELEDAVNELENALDQAY